MANPPTGTVTFLFTDIEGSTKRWEQYPQAMKAALRRHDYILRSAIEINGGYVFKTVGDAFCAAFFTPHDALSAALAVQLSLHQAEWSAEIGQVKVRVAMHTGVAEERDGDYFGQPVNRVARLLSAGHGGQTLLSDPAYDLVRDSLPGGISLHDLGERRLKDLIRPERIFQLVSSSLPTEFPPLKTLDSRPNNLPIQHTELIGRKKEVASIVERMGQPKVRLLTLTGPGGTGKTRLVLQAGAELLDGFHDGVFFVNLAPISDPDLVVSTIAQTLGLKETAGQPLVDTLKNYLKEKSLLLLLDNFEQVVEAAPQVNALLEAASQLKVLVTSRVPLKVQGEKEYPVPPLSLPDPKRLPPLERLAQYESVRLFIERATDVKPDFQVNNENAPAVAEICARLDGLPLAIVLAAARIRLLSPQAMLTRLQSHVLSGREGRLKLLTGGSRDLPARQQTLRGTIEWSYDLLSDDEKKLFRRLSVFVGGRTLEAIEAVCNDDGDLQIDVLDGVESLVSKSLLRQEEGVGGEPRFVMLETIHEFAQEKVEESGEAEELRIRHALYFMELAEKAGPQMHGSQQVEWLDRLEEDHNNLRAALDWSQTTTSEGGTELGLRLAGALVRFWEVRGYLTEGRGWLTRTLAHDAVAPHASVDEGKRAAQRARAGALNGAARLAYLQGAEEAAQPLIEESVALSRELGNKADLAVALSNLGFVLLNLEDLVGAQAAHEESLAIRRELVRKEGIATGLANLGLMAAHSGDYHRAWPLLTEGLSLYEELGNKEGRAYTIRHLGFTAHSQSDYKQAGALLRESLIFFWDQGHKRVVAECLAELAAITGGQGEPERAARLFGAAQALYEALGTAMWNINRPLFERDLTTSRAQLDEDDWQEALLEGRAMSLEQAIAYALEQT